jgi:hypothetical protein
MAGLSASARISDLEDNPQIASQKHETTNIMKVYNLCCPQEHRFEGWFASEDDFMAQADKHLISCPVCESSTIRRLPSAPRLNLSAPASPEQISVEQLQRQWFEIARQVIANTEDVGERFAEEARRMHYNESPQRGIRGIASEEERTMLAEEGIDVAVLPLPMALKQPLQ